jgi:hypothetical protein
MEINVKNAFYLMYITVIMTIVFVIRAPDPTTTIHPFL